MHDGYVYCGGEYLIMAERNCSWVITNTADLGIIRYLGQYELFQHQRVQDPGFNKIMRRNAHKQCMCLNNRQRSRINRFVGYDKKEGFIVGDLVKAGVLQARNIGEYI
jgi:hypothetical protein